MMKKLLTYLFIPSYARDMTSRILLGASFLAFGVCFLATLSNLLMRMPFLHTFLVAISGCFFGLFYLWVRRNPPGSFAAIVFYVYNLSLLSYLWFTAQGLTGSTPVFFVYIAFVLSFLTQNIRQHLLLGSGLVFLVGGLIYLEQLFPQWLTPYPDAQTQSVDLGISYLLAILFSLYFAGYIKRQYDLERTKVEQAEKYKADFFSKMSHELRTPLNAVIGFTGVLLKNKEDNLTSRQLKYLERMDINGKHLLNLVNDILDISKLEAGQMGVQMELCELGSFLETVCEQFKLQAESQGLEFCLDIPEKITPLNTDQMKLKRILINLLANALKFTSEGQVGIRVYTDDLNTPTHLEVFDTGIGIPQHKQQAIFESFHQLDNPHFNSVAGTGLGLAISRELSALLGYTLTLTSEAGEGSTFTLRLNPEGKAS